MYFAFTSLSTVGFGDLYPRNNPERVMCALLLLIGVAIFSYVLGIYNEILDEFTTLLADLDESDNLIRFMMVIKRFNDGKRLDPKFQD